ncbi:transposable element Tcb2 transposase [Trichonephila clavipes]|nr:transposable element Tcb2 transposase [Trichonephila clavipes]
MQRLPWPAYSPDMSRIEHVWDLVGRSCARDLRPAASKDELLLRIQARWNSLSQADIQNMLDFMSRRIENLLQRVVDAPNTDFRHLILFFCFENSVIYLY